MNIQKKYLNIFDFFPDGVEVGNSTSFHNVDSKDDNLVIQITNASAIEMKVQGCVNPYDDSAALKDDSDCDWEDLAIVNLGSYAIVSSATAKGVYAVPMSGLRKIRCVVSSVTAESGKSVTIQGGFGE